MLRNPPHRSAPALAFLLVLLAAGAPAGAQEEDLCSGAHRYLVEEVGMTAVTEAETIDDWRTGETLAGCRITAAGLTARSLAGEARHFFEQIRRAGWSRTPDPRDAPNEASLRFRKGGADCLFSFYSGGLLGTEAEDVVDDATVPGPGERRYNFVVLCLPERSARPREPDPRLHLVYRHGSPRATERVPAPGTTCPASGRQAERRGIAVAMPRSSNAAPADAGCSRMAEVFSCRYLGRSP